MNGRVSFGACTLDLDTRQLWRDGTVVPLSPKAFALLAVLLRERPRALAKQELLDRVWSGIALTDASLSRTVHEIRRAIGDCRRNDGIIRTLSGYGYAFNAEAIESPPSAIAGHAVGWCLVIGTRVYALDDDAQVVAHDRVSSAADHGAVVAPRARFRAQPNGVVVENLHSSDQPWVRGAQVSGSTSIGDGDVVVVGGVEIMVRARGTVAKPTGR